MPLALKLRALKATRINKTYHIDNQPSADEVCAEQLDLKQGEALISPEHSMLAIEWQCVYTASVPKNRGELARIEADYLTVFTIEDNTIQNLDDFIRSNADLRNTITEIGRIAIGTDMRQHIRSLDIPGQLPIYSSEFPD